MGQVIDFGVAKDCILGKVAEPASSELSDALEHFSFSRLPERERIAQTIVNILYQQADEAMPVEINGETKLRIAGNFDFGAVADEIVKYAKDGFTRPFQKVVSDAKTEAPVA
jgi:hypothetical protein